MSAMRDFGDQPLTLGAAAERASHVRLHPGFVYEDQPCASDQHVSIHTEDAAYDDRGNEKVEEGELADRA